MSKEREPSIVRSDTIKSQAEIDAEIRELQEQGFQKSEDVDLVQKDEMSAEEREGRARMAAFYALPEKERFAKVATILDRGVIFERLKVDLPDDLYGEWCRNDPLEIDRMRTLGFWVDDRYATKRALHSDGTSSNIVGDVIHVITTRQNKDMIDKVKAEQARIAQNPRRAPEESDSAYGSIARPDPVIPMFSTSSQQVVSAADVKAALGRANNQTRVQR